MSSDIHMGPRTTDRLRFMAARAMAWVTGNAERWVPDTGRLASHPWGERATALYALANARTAHEVKALLEQEETLSPDFVQGVAERCGAITPALACWLVTVQPITVESLAVNPRLFGGAERAATLVLQRRFAACRSTSLGWTRVLEALLAMERRRPGLVIWNAEMQAAVRRYTDPVHVRPSLWLKLAACERAPADLVEDTWPGYALWSGLANADLMVELLQHPRGPRDLSDEVLRRLQEGRRDQRWRPTKALVLAVIRAAEGAQRRPWWTAALAVDPALTLRVLSEERGPVDGGRSLDGVFTHEDLVGYLTHENAQVRLAAICLLPHVQPTTAMIGTGGTSGTVPERGSEHGPEHGPAVGVGDVAPRVGCGPRLV